MKAQVSGTITNILTYKQPMEVGRDKKKLLSAVSEQHIQCSKAFTEKY